MIRTMCVISLYKDGSRIPDWWLYFCGMVALTRRTAGSAEAEYSATRLFLLNIPLRKIFNFDRVEINFTFSAGVSTSSEVFSNHQMASREKVGVLINMADQRMYHAKGMGKNRVVFEI